VILRVEIHQDQNNEAKKGVAINPKIKRFNISFYYYYCNIQLLTEIQD